MEKIILEPDVDWAETIAVRGSVQEALRVHGFSDDNAEMGAMVATELAENAIKYGRYDGTDSGRFSIEVQLVPPKEFTIFARQPMPAVDDPNFRRLKKMIHWIQGFENSKEAYQRRVQAIAARNRAPGTPQRGVGLVRIAYEGQAKLDYHLGDGMLTISAVCSCSP